MPSILSKFLNFLLRLKSWQLFVLILLPALFSSFSLISQIINLFGFVVYISWIYAVGTTMHSFLPSHLKPKINYFKISCSLILVNIILCTFFNPIESNKEYFFWIGFMCLMVSALYTFSFAARMLESMIEGEIVGFSDSIKGFLGFWFFPWGLWYIQPAVQRVLDKYTSKNKSL